MTAIPISQRTLFSPGAVPLESPRSANRNWIRAFAVIIAGSLLLRLLAMFAVPLLPEEAYYWMYAQHPSLSYFDHPPMVAWVIRAGTSIFGDNEFGVRAFGNVLMLTAGGLMYVVARLWTGRTEALIAMAAVQVLPAYFATGFIATMDGVLLFFWLLCLCGVSLALRRHAAWGWYLAALGLGGAMLSKYTGVFLGLGALVAVLGVRGWRRQLLSIHPYVAAALALAMFAPVIFWNAQHDWASFRFQFEDRFTDHGASLRTILTFLGGQIAVATPIILAPLASVLYLAARRHRLFTPRVWFMISFSMPLLAVMAYKSLKYSIHINWTLPAYLITVPIIARLGVAASRRRRIARRGDDWIPWVRWSAIACVAINMLACAYLLLLQPHFQAPAEFGPWRNLAAAVEDVEDRLEAETNRQPLIIANGEYRLASILAFYCTPLENSDDEVQRRIVLNKYVTSQWFIRGSGLGYEYWSDPKQWIGHDCIFVNDKRDLVKNLENRFQSVELVSDPRLPAGGPYQMAICRGYRGPVPPRSSPVTTPSAHNADS